MSKFNVDAPVTIIPNQVEGTVLEVKEKKLFKTQTYLVKRPHITEGTCEDVLTEDRLVARKVADKAE